MSLNDLLRRSVAQQVSDVGHAAHASGLAEAADVCRDSASFLREQGFEAQAIGCDGLELILRARASDRLALAKHCATCGAVLVSHVHASHCEDGPSRPCAGSSCSITAEELATERGKA